MRRILVPVDFTPRSRAALRYAIGLAQATGAELQTLHVVPPPSDMLRRAQAYVGLPQSQVTAEVMAHADAELDALISSVPHTCRIDKQVLAGDAASTVVQVADDQAFDLVVLSAHPRGKLATLVLGSVTHAVMTCARCPVLSIHPQ